MKTFSIIIIYREAHPDRRNNLEVILSYLEKNKNDSNFEVIVIEQDTEPKISDGFYKHIFIYNPGYFNRSWGFNVGAVNSESDRFVFCDCDLLIKFSDLLEAISYLEKYDAVNPKGTIYDVEENVPDPFSYRNKTRISSNFAGGILLIRKDKFFEMGGWDEDFEGWGGEDDAMSEKIVMLASHISLNFTLYHLFHSNKVFACDEDFNKYMSVQNNAEKYKRNLKTLEVIVQLSRQGTDKLIEYCKSKGPIGCADKYK